jgi:hypothetical protein
MVIVNVDVMSKKLVVNPVVPGKVVVRLKNTVLVDVSTWVITAGEPMIVVVMNSTVPQFMASIDGPAGKHADRPGY